MVSYREVSLQQRSNNTMNACSMTALKTTRSITVTHTSLRKHKAQREFLIFTQFVYGMN